MRFGIAVLTCALAFPATGGAQPARRVRNVERFEVAGLPQSPASDLEREIFLLLRVHRKGDLVDASRIHAKLGQYYKQRGDSTLSDACDRMAVEAWEAASGERSPSAASPGSPPFEPRNTFARGFIYTDGDLRVEHTWDFYDDGTYAHVVTPLDQARPGPRELGWYTIGDGGIRLWQARPRVDKTLTWTSLGDGGKDGAVLNGVTMKVLP